MPAGRPTTFDTDKAKRICKLVAGGTPMLYAAEATGVGERTLYSWLSRGEGEGAADEFRQFVQDIKAARSKALVFRIKRIRKHGAKNWKADAWWCERMFADEFGVDKRAIQELAEQLAAARAELEAVRANARRAEKRARARRRRDRGTVKGHGDGV